MDHRNHGDSRVLKRVLLAGLFLTLASQAFASVIVPHRAIYDLQLLRTTQGANVGAVSGRMAYEVSGSECDGWTVSFRLVNRFDYKEGTSRLFDTQSSSWETGDGKAMNYSEREFVDNKQESEKRLSVARAEKRCGRSQHQPAKGEENFHIGGNDFPHAPSIAPDGCGGKGRNPRCFACL